MAGKAGKTSGKLSALQVTRAKPGAFINDGLGLYLKVDEGGSKSWVLRYKVNGRSRKYGLGPVHTVGLALARDKAGDARRLLLDGRDPIDEKRKVKAAARLEQAKAISFDECAAAYIKAHKAGWRSADHTKEWQSTLRRFVSPIFGKLPVQSIDVGLVVRALEKIWTTNPVTASRVRGRVEMILDYAKAREYRTGENPARWKGNLDNLLPLASKVKVKQHFAAMPYADVGALMAKLSARDEVSAFALAFTILTAARSGETIGAQWDEIDFKDRLWVIPGTRMKAGKDHSSPLSDQAIAILEEMKARQRGDFVFAGRKGKGISKTGMANLLNVTFGYDAATATVHGMRSSFRDWCSENTNYPREVCEAALAHVVGDQVEAAYRRSDLLERRRRLMSEWAAYVNSSSKETGKLIPIRRGKQAVDG